MIKKNVVLFVLWCLGFGSLASMALTEQPAQICSRFIIAMMMFLLVFLLNTPDKRN